MKVKMGAIIRDISEGALKWYKMAGWKILEVEKNDKSNTKKKTTTHSNL